MGILYIGKLQPKFIGWVYAFVVSQFNYLLKRLSLIRPGKIQAENFRGWGFLANLEIDNTNYLVGLLACWQ